MNKYVNDFLLMFQFLTRIPVNISLKCEKENFKRGAIFLPLVGFIVGGIQWLVYMLFFKVSSLGIAAIFAVLSGILVTGALHVDGLGDTCDGFYAFKGKDRIIEIMKDSRIGTFACIAIVMDIMLKVNSLAYSSQYSSALIIIAVPVISKFSIVFLSFVGKPAKSTGSGNLFVGNMSGIVVFISAFIAGAIIYIMLGLKVTAAMFITAVTITLLVNKYSESKINGLTGDLLGANNEIVEIFVMLVYIALYKI